MLRTIRCVSATHDFLASLAGPGDVPSHAALAEAVASTMAASERLDERAVLLSVLCNAAAREASLYAASAEAELVALTKAPRRRSNSRLEPWVARALSATGIDVDQSELDVLDTLSMPAARLASRLLAASTAATQSRSGYLAQELAGIYDATEQTPTIAEAMEVAASYGIDAERLCWAAISRESVRHVLLVFKEANRAARSWQDRSADSLVGYAYQGLRLALRNYDPSRGMFSTYACPRIRGTIRDGIRSESHLPKRLTTFIRKVEGAKEKLTQDLGRHPTLQEVATSLDLELDKLAPIKRYAPPVSYDDIMARPGAAEPSALVTTADPLAAAELAERSSAIAEALESIDAADALAVRLLVLEQLSVAEVAESLGVSARVLRARRDRGLAALAELLSDWAPIVS